jgi:hypothetical protein
MPRLQGERNVNLAAPRLREMSWDKQLAGLGELFIWAEGLAQESIDWYLSEKRHKARWSRSLRAAAVIFVTLGGAVPLAALTAGKAALGNWGFVLIGFAAGCLTYDRFAGYSSAWLRYMATATRLRVLLNDFQLDWVKLMAAVGAGEPSVEQVGIMIDAVQSFARSVNDVIVGETQAWLVEFNANLAELKTRAEPGTNPGGG